MSSLKVFAQDRVEAERDGDHDEGSGERVEGGMARIPSIPTEEESQEDGDGREDDQSERSADGWPPIEVRNQLVVARIEQLEASP